jgi:hypothetical protein
MITSTTAQMQGVLKLLRENSVHFRELSITFPMDYEGMSEASEHSVAEREQRYIEAYRRMEKVLTENGVASKFERKYESIRAINAKKITSVKTASGKIIDPDTIQLTIANGDKTNFIYRILMDQEICGGPYAQILRPRFVIFERHLEDSQSKGIPKVNELLKQYGYTSPDDRLPSILDNTTFRA